MMLKHKVVRGLISLGVITFTSTFFVYELMNSYRSMNAYMSYIVEKAESSLLQDKYQNQSIASFLTRRFNTPVQPLTSYQQQQICAQLEYDNQVKGINLIHQHSLLLSGTFQTLASDCRGWPQDIPQLTAFDKASLLDDADSIHKENTTSKDRRITYYVDLQNKYIYASTFINTESFTLSPNDFLKYGRLNVDTTVLNGFMSSSKAVPKIYHDTFRNKNVMSIMSPVYVAGKLKGIVVSDYSLSNLQDIFYPYDRPLVSRNLDITIKDTHSLREINVLSSKKSIFNYVTHKHEFSHGLQVRLSLDVLYFLLSSWKIILFYFLFTAALLQLVRLHFRHYHNVSRDNISDTMTGLYNRKILTDALESRLQRAVAANTPVTFIAMDCDKLKYINDTWGHEEGDRAIITLAHGINNSIRGSDYPVRLGGDEFMLILLNFPLADTPKLIQRIEQNIKELDDSGRIHFSWGSAAMKPTDTLQDMYKAADLELYINKKKKSSERPV